MIDKHQQNIKQIGKEFLEIIEKYYPGLTNCTYDSFGHPSSKGSSALERIEMCIYVELMKAGAFSNAPI